MLKMGQKIKYKGKEFLIACVGKDEEFNAQFMLIDTANGNRWTDVVAIIPSGEIAITEVEDIAAMLDCNVKDLPMSILAHFKNSWIERFRKSKHYIHESKGENGNLYIVIKYNDGSVAIKESWDAVKISVNMFDMKI